MSVVERLSSFIAGMRSRLARRDGDEPAPAQATPEPDVDPAEEFVKIQRGLRRLSLASDRSGEILQAVATRLDEVQQSLLTQSRPQQAALALDEAQLLQLLDQLDRLAGVPELPAAVGALLQETQTTLLTRARWRPVALAGAQPGADIRIAECSGDSAATGPTDIRIYRILEQGYRRADGTLLRPGIVIASALPQTQLRLNTEAMT